MTYNTGFEDFDALLSGAKGRAPLLAECLAGVVGQTFLNALMIQAMTDPAQMQAAMMGRVTAHAMEQMVIALCAPFLFEPADPAHWFAEGLEAASLTGKRAEVVALRDDLARILPPLDATRYTHALSDPVDELARLWPSPLRLSASFVLTFMLSEGVNEDVIARVRGLSNMEWIRRYVAALWRVSVAYLSVLDEAIDRAA